MSKTMKHFGCVVISLGLMSAVAFAQISRIEPAQPKIGETLTVIYNPKAEGAKFTEIVTADMEKLNKAAPEESPGLLYSLSYGYLLLNQEEKSRETAASAPAKKAAPAFKATALSGKQYELSALRGKVVVLNFWFIGCAPCKVEIPGLNKLVKEFKDQGVVFLAFSPIDPAEDLRGFLKKTEFDYEIIPDEFSNPVVEQFNIGPYPTHIIIDREGNIEAMLTGGSENRHEDIRPLIMRLLKVK